jgi:hypothetical protein
MQGLFGTIHKQYERKGQKAVNFLLRKKEGEVPNAIFHSKIGWIDLVWRFEGTNKSDGYGLSKILKYHKSGIKYLAKTIKELEVTFESDNRYKLESKRHFATVSKVWFENDKTWLLTFFEKKI